MTARAKPQGRDTIMHRVLGICPHVELRPSWHRAATTAMRSPCLTQVALLSVPESVLGQVSSLKCQVKSGKNPNCMCHTFVHLTYYSSHKRKWHIRKSSLHKRNWHHLLVLRRVRLPRKSACASTNWLRQFAKTSSAARRKSALYRKVWTCTRYP